MSNWVLSFHEHTQHVAAKLEDDELDLSDDNFFLDALRRCEDNVDKMACVLSQQHRKDLLIHARVKAEHVTNPPKLRVGLTLQMPEHNPQQVRPQFDERMILYTID